jgi:fido (protein-threonine AMPylation protein)
MNRDTLLKTIYDPFFKGVDKSSTLYKNRLETAIAFRTYFKAFEKRDYPILNKSLPTLSNLSLTKFSRESCRLEGLYDSDSIDSHRKTISYIINTTRKRKVFFITTKELLTSHRILIKDNILWGFREFPIAIKDYPLAIFPHPSEIDMMLKLFIRWLYSYDREKVHPFFYACDIFLYFTHIHPFLDGNGRLGRSLMTAFLLHHNISIPSFMYDRKSYLEVVYKAQQLGDRESFYKFTLEKGY